MKNTPAQKVFHVVETFVAMDGPVSLAELSNRLEIPKPTLHRILVQLETARMIERVTGTRKFNLGSAAVRLATRTVQSAATTMATRTILKQLTLEIGETCNIGILDARSVLYIERVESNWPLRLHLGVGSRVPLHCTAIGKMILAQIAPSQRARLLGKAKLPRHTDNTIVDRHRLSDVLGRIREAGVSTNDEEYVEGLIGIAVPIYGARRKVIAGLAINAPKARLDVDAALLHAGALKQAASELAVLAKAA